jgi:hypothetical protein
MANAVPQDDFKIEAYGEVTPPPDVGFNDSERTEVEDLARQMFELTGVRPGRIVAFIYQQMQE